MTTRTSSTGTEEESMTERDWESFNSAQPLTKELVHITEGNMVLLYLGYSDDYEEFLVWAEWTETEGFYEDPQFFVKLEEAEKCFDSLFDELYNPTTDDALREVCGYDEGGAKIVDFHFKYNFIGDFRTCDIALHLGDNYGGETIDFDKWDEVLAPKFIDFLIETIKKKDFLSSHYVFEDDGSLNVFIDYEPLDSVQIRILNHDNYKIDWKTGEIKFHPRFYMPYRSEN